MKILVTGGAGYIGSHACKLLKAAGFVPVVVDNLSRGHQESVKWGPFYKADLSETKKIQEILEKEQISAVVHFAAYAYVGESMQDPMLYFQNNVGGTISLLQAMSNANVKDIVFSSTCATYGYPERLPITEDTKQNPINPYGQTKLMSEQILQSLTKQNFRVVALRYFNAAGADPEGEVGESHDPETHLIPLVIRAALSKKPVQIYGQDYATHDGTCVRDYIHVTDLAHAHVQALKYLRQAVPGHFLALNLGTGAGLSVEEIVRAVESQLNTKIERQLIARRPGDPDVLVASPERARSVLGWDTTHSSIQEIIQTATAWIQKPTHNTTL
jgi:UDP-glucose-4-epimerase GalE